MHIRFLPGIILGPLCTLGIAQQAHAAAAFKEDLTDCKLPHGELLMPVAGTPDAAKGTLLKLTDGSLTPLPGAGGDKPLDRAALTKDLVEKNTGDLELIAGDKPAFWAVSGRIVDVGAKYLYQAAAMKLDRPALIPGGAKRPAGFLPGVDEGRTFLVETASGGFALVRVLEITKAGASIQYVYEPSGKLSFAIPQGTLIDLITDPVKTGPATLDTLPDAGAPGEPPTPGRVIGATGTPGTIVIHVGDDMPGSPEPTLQTVLAERKRLIASRLKIVDAPAKTPAEIQKKIAAINDLAALRADEAVDTLIRQISFVNPNDSGKEPFQDSVHPCFAALKRMGKPASEAAIKALRQLDLTTPPSADVLRRHPIAPRF
jgi:hypothetical protein